jgi:hypothetical protein
MDLLSGLQTEEELLKACVYEYHKVYGEDWQTYLVENARLLHLLRSRDDVDLKIEGNLYTVTPTKLWEIPYDTSNYFYRDSFGDLQRGLQDS